MESTISSESISCPSSTRILGGSSASPVVYLDKCVVCGKPASKKCGGCSLAFYCGPQHQRADWARHKHDCKPYKVDTMSEEYGGTCGLLALKLIQADTIIISEYPLLSFENLTSSEGLDKILEIVGALPIKCFGCQVGWIRVGMEEQKLCRCLKCGLPMCSEKCSDNPNHVEGDCKLLAEVGAKECRGASELARIPEDLRLFRLLCKEKAKGTPITLKAGCSGIWTQLVRQAKGLKGPENVKTLFPLSVAATGGTAEGVEVVRLLSRLINEYSIPVDPTNKRKFALFEKHCYLTHSCCPNVECWLDTSGLHLKLHCRIIRRVIPGEPLTIFRSLDPTLICNPTLPRRLKLMKQSLPLEPCTCTRCTDPTELNTHLSALRCLVCKDVSSQLTCNYYYPSNPLERRTSWNCNGKQCRSTKTHEQILVITLKAEKDLEQIWKGACVTSSANCEAIITKLQSFIVRHQRKILHPSHYLLLICRSRINRVVSHFLGSGHKLFLCVATGQPRAYDYCAYKVEHLHNYLNFISKLYSHGSTRISAKLRYELVFCEGALVFRDFAEERMAGSSFFRRLHGVMENVQSCQKTLAPYQDCKALVEGVKQFGQMLRKLLGQDFTSQYRLKLLQSSGPDEENLRKAVKTAIEKWTQAAETIGLRQMYVTPNKGKGLQTGSGSVESNDKLIGNKQDLFTILMNVPPKS